MTFVANDMKRLGPAQQLRVLRATGVEILLLDRDWPGLTSSPRLRSAPPACASSRSRSRCRRRR